MRAVSYEERAKILATLEEWKQHQDYSEGVKHYQKWIGENGTYWVLLLGSSSYNQEKLLASLTQLEEELREQHIEANNNEPEQVKEWRRATKSLMNERAALKAQLRVVDKEERKTKAFQILEISDTLDDLFGRIDLYEQQGHLYQPIPVVESPLRRFLNLRSYISRTKKQLIAAILPDDIAKLQKKLEKYELELTALAETAEVKDYLHQ
ncbi:hypothetical protein [Runella zeae]|uniref:hypothetical protein n=1 Tax=Runella zeae TaxID=94255 RepID=UPI00040503E6|nr:hypothetical protein [Runella zeae]